MIEIEKETISLHMAAVLKRPQISLTTTFRGHCNPHVFYHLNGSIQVESDCLV
jgi:hypothetical protein